LHTAQVADTCVNNGYLGHTLLHDEAARHLHEVELLVEGDV
jgi:hypothetical protein